MEVRRIRSRLPLIILALAFALTAALAPPTTALAASDLSINVIDAPDPVPSGSNITYTVTITNGGPDVATNTNFAFVADVRLFNAISLTPQLGGAPFTFSQVPGEPNFTGNIPTMNSGQSATIVLIVNVPLSVAAGATLTSNASVTPGVPDANPGNNAFIATTAVAPALPGADLRVTVTPTGTPLLSGRNQGYFVVLDNLGPNAAVNVLLTVPVPAGTTFVSFVQTSGTFTVTPSNGTSDSTATLANFAANGNARFTLTVAVPAGAATGSTITASATASSATTDPNAGNNTGQSALPVTFVGPDQHILITDTPDPVQAGANITYTITLSNTNATAQNAVTTVPIPAGTTFVSAAQTSGTQVFTMAGPTAGAVTFSRTNFSANQTVVFTLVVMVDAATPNATVISETVTAASGTNFGQGDFNLADNTATTTTSVGTATTPPIVPPTTPPTVGNTITGNTPAAPTPVPTPVVPASVFLPALPQVFQNAGALGVVQAGNHTPTAPRPAVAVAPAVGPSAVVIMPPSTGDAGLR